MDDPLITRWIDLKSRIENFKKIQDEEKELRQLIVAKYFKEPAEGTYTHMESGLIIKASVSYTRKVDLTRIDFKKLRELKINNNTLFRYSAELNLTQYRNLKDSQLEFVNEFVTTKPALPTLTIELGE